MNEAETPSAIGILEGTDPISSPARRYGASLWIFCLALSLGAHAWVLLSLIGSEEITVGDAGRTDAIAVEIVQLPLIASSQTAPDAAAEAAEKKILQPPEPVENKQVQDHEEGLKAASIAEKPVQHEQKKDNPVQEEQEKAHQLVEKTNETKPSPQQIQGIALSASGASAGEIERYGREVARALAKSRPKARGYRGSLTLAFVLDPEGKLASLKVKDSSGNAALDQAAMNAVRAIAFPRPPQGMSELQRSYIVPFRFN